MPVERGACSYERLTEWHWAEHLGGGRVPLTSQKAGTMKQEAGHFHVRRRRPQLGVPAPAAYHMLWICLAT